MQAVMRFGAFSEDNDPHGEHDFGQTEMQRDGATTTLWWKIDLYDTSYGYGSEVRDDPGVTRRVLTLLLPEDY